MRLELKFGAVGVIHESWTTCALARLLERRAAAVMARYAVLIANMSVSSDLQARSADVRLERRRIQYQDLIKDLFHKISVKPGALLAWVTRTATVVLATVRQASHPAVL